MLAGVWLPTVRHGRGIEVEEHLRNRLDVENRDGEAILRVEPPHAERRASIVQVNGVESEARQARPRRGESRRGSRRLASARGRGRGPVGTLVLDSGLTPTEENDNDQYRR